MLFIVTGGAGYIGSHIIFYLLQQGHRVVCIDTLVNSTTTVFSGMPNLENLVIQSEYEYKDPEKVEAVIHLAALKSIPESFENPVDYYENNIGACCHALQLMETTGCSTFIYSSSAAVYAPKSDGFFRETDPTIPATPYGRTKLICEQLISDFSKSHPGRYFCLRYFNPYGGHEKIGKKWNNLIPAIRKALDQNQPVELYGDSHPTPDGSCIRDFIHIHDLVMGHLSCLMKKENGFFVYNLGTGKGTSVFEVAKAFSQGHPNLQVVVKPARVGDAPVLVACIDKIQAELGWHPTRPTFSLE